MDLSNKKQLERFKNNAEIEDINKALGAGIGSSFDADRTRYERVYFSCDSDVDGAAISTLLTGVFYKLFRPMLEQGRVYLTCSPLFTIKSGSDVFYALNDAEKNKIVKGLEKKNKKYTLERAKGLGELPKETFSDIVLNAKNRKVIQLTIEDGKKAEEWLDLCLADGRYEFEGETFSGADARKAWMRDNSEVVSELGVDY